MKNINKITTVLSLGVFSLYLAFNFSKLLIEKAIVTADKNVVLLLSFFLIFGTLTLIITSLYKSFSKSNSIIIEGNGNVTNQDMKNENRIRKDNQVNIKGDNNDTSQDK